MSGPNILPNFLKSARIFNNKKHVEIKEPFKEHPYVFAAISIIAKNIAHVPFKFWKDPKLSDKNERAAAWKRAYSTDPKIRANTQYKELKSGKWPSLFEEPNETMTSFQLIQAIVTHYLLEGGCFVVLGNKDRTTAIPTRMEVSGPKGWTPIFNKNNHLSRWKRKYWVVDENGNRQEKEKTYRSYQVLWFYNFNPYSPIEGLATYKPAELSVKQDHHAAQYNEAFFRNGAVIGTILETEQPLERAEADYMLDQFNEQHQGHEQSHKTKLLHSGVKAKNLHSSHRDMEYRLLREWTRDEVLSVFGTPKAMLGLVDDVNRATFLGSKRSWFETTLIPLMSYISQVFYVKMLKPVDSSIVGYFDLALVEGLRGDNKEKAEVAAIYTNIGVPFNDLNDRFDLGLPEYTGKWATEGHGDSKNEPSETSGQTVDDENVVETPAPAKIFIDLLDSDFNSCSGKKFCNLLSAIYNLTEDREKAIITQLDDKLKVIRGLMLLKSQGYDDSDREDIKAAIKYQELPKVKWFVKNVAMLLARG